MQEEPLTIITRMNRAYTTIYGTLHPETRRNAEQTFSRGPECLWQRGIPFHQTLAGTWVLDTATTQGLPPFPQSQQQKEAL